VIARAELASHGLVGGYQGVAMWLLECSGWLDLVADWSKSKEFKSR